MAQVSGWVPKDRRPYAREVLAALARGANSLPPDPEQVAALEAAQAVAKAAEVQIRAALVEVEATRETGRQAEMVAMARVEAAERAQEAIRGKLQAVEAAMIQAQEEAKRLHKLPGVRGWIVRWLANID
jgi:hypothetical protein